jgi:hypothetical protein
MGLRVGQCMGRRRVSRALRRQGRSYELLDSQPIPRCTESGAHARIVRRVIGAFRRQLSERPWRAVRARSKEPWHPRSPYPHLAADTVRVSPYRWRIPVEEIPP